MREEISKLGKIISIHPISPATMQRAVIVAVLSFLFFLAMMFAFYIRQNIGYFLLSTAFLIVYIVTMFSWILMRKNVVKIYENGLSYKDFTARWNEVKEVSESGKKRWEIRKSDGKKIVLTESIADSEKVVRYVRSKAAKSEKVEVFAET